MAVLCLFLESNEGNELVKRSLLFAAIITYAKPFLECRGRRKKLKKDCVFSTNDFYKKTHNQLMNIRNKYIAHGDKSKFEFVMTRIALFPEPNKKAVLAPYQMVISTAGLSSENITDYIEIINVVLNFVQIKIDQLNRYIIKEAKNKNINYLYENSYNHADVS